MNIVTFFYHNGIKLLVRINYNLHEMKLTESHMPLKVSLKQISKTKN